MNAAQAWKELEPFHPTYVFSAVGSCFVVLTPGPAYAIPAALTVIAVTVRSLFEVTRQELKRR